MTVAAIGLDAGSTTFKLVALDAHGAIVATRLAAAEPRIEVQAESLIAEVLAETQSPSREAVEIVATGYGRKLIKSASRNVTEITCHARGVFAELGRPGTLVDIGGQDSKVIKIGERGRAVDFVMNDKCAAGTGRFLETTAARLGVPLDELGPRAMASATEERISSTCTVFAESEIISLLAHGSELPPILRGLHRSLISRVVAMIRGLGLTPPLMLSGGVARNEAVRALLGEATGQTVLVPTRPQLMGAYGAALLALDR